MMAKEAATKEAVKEMKFGIGDAADKLGVDEATARAKLRNAGLKPAGKRWGWDSKTAMETELGKLTKAKEPAKGADKAKDAGKGKDADKAKAGKAGGDAKADKKKK